MDIQPVFATIVIGGFAIASLGYFWLKFAGQIPGHNLEDEVLGPIDYENSVWTGEQARFEPDGSTVLVTLPGDQSGPYNVARQAYAELQRRYGDLRPRIAPLLVEERSFLRPDDPLTDPEAVFDEVWVREVRVLLPTDPQQPLVEIELGFGATWDEEHSYDVLIREWEPVELKVDG